MRVVEVALADAGYEVRIGFGVLEASLPHLTELLRQGSADKPVPIVADAAAKRLHGESLASALRQGGFEASWYEVADGESSKSWAELQKLTDWLLDQGITRNDHVLAFGGGVVGDLTGFASAIVKRGCRFVQLPTTLLAQVDSSVGGKTGINTAAGKNLIGAFHQPSLVLADTGWLSTLPPRQMRAGYAEVLKYGILGDAGFFKWLEEHGAKVLTGEEPFLTEAVARSVAAKAAIVAEDERETTGRRALLNLGHTFGHALEAATGFSDQLLHGEAVALGMVLAARYSARRGDLMAAAADRIDQAVQQAGLPATLGSLELACAGNDLVAHMRHDKKMEGNTLPFVLLRDIGDAYLARDVMMLDLAQFLDAELQR